MSKTMESVASVSTAELTKQANAITNRRTLYAAGAGLIPFPVVDVAALLGIQVFMIRDLSRVYEVDFSEQRVKSIITVLVSDLGVLGVMSGVKAIPVVGSVIGMFTAPITGAATTYALGKVFTQHYSQGGTLLNFDPVASRKYFQEAYEEGKLYVEKQSNDVEETKEEKSSFWESKSKKEMKDLRRQNEEMKAMMQKMQASIDALKPS